MEDYDWVQVEKKWQDRWQRHTKNMDYSKPKYYGIFAYPSPSSFLHIGQMRGFTLLDIYLRLKRMQGYNTYFPAGTHSTGIPSYGFVKKLKEGNAYLLESLKEYGASAEEIEKLKNSPEYAAYYLGESYKKSWKAFGLLIDEESYAITISPQYKKFIEWQFKKLKEKGFLIQKPHYAPYCPSCGPVAVDPSESDLSKGGNAETIEYTMIFFHDEKGTIYPAATLRPETIFGVTNLWINEKESYVKIKVDNDLMVIAEKSIDKFIYQYNAQEIEKVSAVDILEQSIVNPITKNKIPVYTSSFVDPSIGTGIVMSVPAHAPYDYAAILSSNLSIQPIPLIKVEGSKEKMYANNMPAVDAIKEWGIKGIADPRLEELTKLIYKKEFHEGTMLDNCMEYSGKPVRIAKEEITKSLYSMKLGSPLYEFSEEVICRCGKNVIIKKIENQWFIKYSDKEIKEKTKKHIMGMEIHPEEYKQEFSEIIDWYEDRACTRKGHWLGTALPFDNSWIIEPIADSTLYPAFYIVSRYYNEGKLSIEDLTDDFFDAVFYGKDYHGKNQYIPEIRKAFQYWYPLDINVGGKEHKRVHFPVFMMMHTMMFDEPLWPRGIMVNWWVTQKGGEKISKSKGGNLPFVLKAPMIYSSDALRMFYSSVSTYTDLEWNEDEVLIYKNRLQRLWNIIKSPNNIAKEEKYIDQWLDYISKYTMKSAFQAINNMDFRVAMQIIYYQFPSYIEWYLARGGNNDVVYNKAIESLIKMMYPITPHIAEELWNNKHSTMLIEETYVDTAIEENPKIIQGEEFIKDIIEDIQALLNIIKKEPQNISIVVSPEWKNSIYEKIKNSNMTNIGDFIKEYISKGGGKKNASKSIMTMVDIARSGKVLIDEMFLLNDAKQMIEKKFNTKVSVSIEEIASKKEALPLKPAIYIET
ncbi:MAG: leucine--tRNA ligase [Thermoplasmata archaeon]